MPPKNCENDLIFEEIYENDTTTILKSNDNNEDSIWADLIDNLSIQELQFFEENAEDLLLNNQGLVKDFLDNDNINTELGTSAELESKYINDFDESFLNYGSYGSQDKCEAQQESMQIEYDQFIEEIQYNEITNNSAINFLYSQTCFVNDIPKPFTYTISALPNIFSPASTEFSSGSSFVSRASSPELKTLLKPKRGRKAKKWSDNGYTQELLETAAKKSIHVYRKTKNNISSGQYRQKKANELLNNQVEIVRLEEENPKLESKIQKNLAWIEKFKILFPDLYPFN